MAYTTVDDPSKYFQTALYTGTGSGFSVTNSGNSNLQPDWVWVKDRSATNDHKITDSSRLASGKPSITLESNTEAAEFDDADPMSTDSFDADGFTIGTNGNYNTDGNTYVAWQWKANGGTATATASESGDNPAYSVQANTDAGFSIVTYTGTGADTSTVAHGLGAVPKMIIFKRRDGTPNWMVHHAKLSSATKRVNLNTTNAEGDASNFLDDTAPTSSVFTLGFSAAVNADGGTFVAYCFAPIQGYSKFGGYTGNASTNGPFIYLGFKPTWIMIRNVSDAANWNIYDNKRSTENVMDDILLANGTDAEGAVSGKSVDFLSNGFKIRGNDNEMNDNADKHVYMAFAESPFVSSEGVPTTAR